MVSILSRQSIDYQISNMGQCKGYHQENGLLQSIGFTARQLNRDYLDTDQTYINQSQRLNCLDLINVLENEVFPALSVWNDSLSGSIDERARAYLEINCAH